MSIEVSNIDYLTDIAQNFIYLYVYSHFKAVLTSKFKLFWG
jgi:hypothetical protein